MKPLIEKMTTAELRLMYNHGATANDKELARRELELRAKQTGARGGNDSGFSSGSGAHMPQSLGGYGK